MNYYPTNYYSTPSYQQQQPMMYQPQMQTQQIPVQTQGLQGKVVDSLDVAKVADVPIGGYGVFPKADLSEIYIKSWNPNGTTGVVTYRPVIIQEEEKTDYCKSEEHEKLLKRIEQLEEKLDKVLESKPGTAARRDRNEF